MRGSARIAGTAGRILPEPVLVVVAEGIALSVFGACRILRDDAECQLRDGRQSLAGVLLHVLGRVLFLQRLDLLATAPICARNSRWAKTVQPWMTRVPCLPVLIHRLPTAGHQDRRQRHPPATEVFERGRHRRPASAPDGWRCRGPGSPRTVRAPGRHSRRFKRDPRLRFIGIDGRHARRNQTPQRATLVEVKLQRLRESTRGDDRAGFRQPERRRVEPHAAEAAAPRNLDAPDRRRIRLGVRPHSECRQCVDAGARQRKVTITRGRRCGSGDRRLGEHGVEPRTVEHDREARTDQITADDQHVAPFHAAMIAPARSRPAPAPRAVPTIRRTCGRGVSLSPSRHAFAAFREPIRWPRPRHRRTTAFRRAWRS